MLRLILVRDGLLFKWDTLLRAVFVESFAVILGAIIAAAFFAIFPTLLDRVRKSAVDWWQSR